MLEDSTTSRVLRLLSLLENRRFWPGVELADRLGVSGRTLRRDIERLRALGYRVHAERGNVGGYQLAPGADLPPLVLSDEEAVTLAVSLRLAAVTGPAVGMAETGMTALAKLEQVLPKRLKRRVSALLATTSTLPPINRDVSSVDPDLLVRLALASRDRQRVLVRYTAADGTTSTRLVEPTALVPRARRWYLVCWDLSRNDWRTLRIDRITEADESGVPSTSRQLPGGDAAAFVAAQFHNELTHQVEVVIYAPHQQAALYLSGHAQHLRADGHDRTRWPLQAEQPGRFRTVILGLCCFFLLLNPFAFGFVRSAVANGGMKPDLVVT